MKRFLQIILSSTLLAVPATAQDADNPPGGENKLIFGTTSSFGNATKGSTAFGKGSSTFGTGNSAFGESEEREAFFEEQAAKNTPQPGFQGVGTSLEERKINLQELEAIRTANRSAPEIFPTDAASFAAGFYDDRCFNRTLPTNYVPPNSPRRVSIACPPGTQADLTTPYVMRGSDGKLYPITRQAVQVRIVLEE